MPGIYLAVPADHPPSANEGRACREAGALARLRAARPRHRAAALAQHPKLLALTRRAKLLPQLALAALLGALLLALAFWLGGGFHLSLLSTPANQPTLRLVSSGPYRIGGSITLHGEQFSRYSIIALLRDGQPAMDSQGLRLAVNADAQGAFTTALPITPEWGPGNHSITAVDTTSQQRVTLVVQVQSP